MAIAIDTLAYARRLREAGFTEEQAEGQAKALAAAMTDSLATKQDLQELETRVDARFRQIDTCLIELEKRLETRMSELEKRVEIRLFEFEKRMETRFAAQEARFDARCAGLEHRLTVRMGSISVAAVSVMSVLMKLL